MEGSQLGVPGGEGSSALKLRGLERRRPWGDPPPSALSKGTFKKYGKILGFVVKGGRMLVFS